jgi:hypothetical protein
MQAVIAHLPHVIPAVVGLLFMARFAVYATRLPPADLSDRELAEWQASRAARRRRHPRRRSRSDELQTQRPQ